MVSGTKEITVDYENIARIDLGWFDAFQILLPVILPENWKIRCVYFVLFGYMT